MPILLSAPDELRAYCDGVRKAGETVGLVPTMGALHDGHLALVRRAASLASRVVVTLFVNPTQFGPTEDFARYPRDTEGDVAKLASAGAHGAFAPAASAMYPEGDATRVHVARLTDVLCGPLRPGHFDGVATVVTKLFALVGPCTAVFGRKDYQQLAVIRRMVVDLHLPVRVEGHPIVREADGLAMSSRNAYLSAEERVRARAIPRALRSAAEAFASGKGNAAAIVADSTRALVGHVDSIDYVTACDGTSLAPLAAEAPVSRGSVLAIACRVGRTRLIDNLVFGEDDPPPSC
jgi:pantoate--beta-alanine ligase